MVTFDEALRVAKEKNPSVDSCTEYKEAYEFYSSKAAEGFGGNESPIVIEKATGDALSFPAAIGEGLLSKEVGKLQVC